MADDRIKSAVKSIDMWMRKEVNIRYKACS